MLLLITPPCLGEVYCLGEDIESKWQIDPQEENNIFAVNRFHCEPWSGILMAFFYPVGS